MSYETLKINGNQVTHLKLYKELNGVPSGWGVLQYRWMETRYFKFLWFIKTPFVTYKEGYYENCERGWIRNSQPIKLNKNQFDRDGWVHTKPRLKIYVGEHLLTTEYFETYNEAVVYSNNHFQCDLEITFD